jgi:hypothetical protein
MIPRSFTALFYFICFILLLLLVADLIRSLLGHVQTNIRVIVAIAIVRRASVMFSIICFWYVDVLVMASMPTSTSMCCCPSKQNVTSPC